MSGPQSTGRAQPSQPVQDSGAETSKAPASAARAVEILPEANTRESTGNDLAKSGPSLPRSGISTSVSPTLTETHAQLSRLASGLSSQLNVQTGRSGLVEQLQLETRLLGGLALQSSLTKVSDSPSHESAQLAHAATGLKNLAERN